jgi:hypothetical protein
MMAESERVWSTAFENASKGDAFAAQLGAVVRAYLDSTAAARDAASRAFAEANVASREDIGLLGERLDRLTDAVDALAEEVRMLRRRRGAKDAQPN